MSTHAHVLVVLGILLSGAHAHARTAAAPDTPALEDLRRELRAPRSETRRSAVRKLAALDTREAWSLVLDALEDADGAVADQAQLSVAALQDPRLVAELCGARGLASRDARVAERAAEAVGRLAGPVDARPVRRAFAGLEPEAARLLAWSVERLAAARRLAGEVEDLARALDGLAGSRARADVRGAALLALARLDARAAEQHVQVALRAREPQLRAAAALAARAWPEIPALAVAAELAADTDAGVRAGAIELLAGIPGRDAALLLVERLEREERARLRWRIRTHLRALSGADHGFDAALWREWARTRAGSVSTGERRADDGPVGDTRVALAGLPLVSDRGAYLIDLSGSMWSTEVAGRTRKAIVDGELRRALEALPRDARFNVIPYTGEPFPWEKRLVAAEPGQVRRALEAFERCHRSGRGNVWDAVEAALADPDVDAVTILTDGVPTGGAHADLALVVPLLLERNRFRNVAFDAVLVDAPRGARAAWQALADGSGGRSVAVDLAALARAKEGETRGFRAGKDG